MRESALLIAAGLSTVAALLGPEASSGFTALPAAGAAQRAGDAGAPHVSDLAATAGHEIKIDAFKFGPATLTVPARTKVVWTNDDADAHTVTSAADPKLLKSPPLDTGESFSFTFDKPGIYRYFCSIHPHMRGTVIVE
jgi:plastocyanin